MKPIQRRFYWVVSSKDEKAEASLIQVRKTLDGRLMLGLRSKTEIPAKPSSPGLACEASLTGSGSDAKLDVRYSVTDAECVRWVPSGRFSIPLFEESREAIEPAKLADAIASHLIDHLVRVNLAAGPRVKGKPTYTIAIKNISPFVVNGLSLTGDSADRDTSAGSMLWGISVPPHKEYRVPASASAVERLRLKKGIHVVAADLSGL